MSDCSALKSFRIFLCGSLLLGAGAHTGQAAPISFLTALPVHQGGLLFRSQGIRIRKHDDPSTARREMDVFAVPSVLIYGAAPKLALMGVFPYLDKELNIRSSGAKRTASGLGDIKTLARYQFFSRNRAGQTARGALFAGLKWPSGRNGKTDGMGLLPRSVQLGSGSYDPIVGTVWTGQWLSFQFDGDVSYRRNTRADGFKFGDVIEQNVSFQYRVWPGSLRGKGVPAFLYGVLEANGISQGKNDIGGAKKDDSGGYQLFLTPGLQWVTKRAVLELATQFPAIQNLSGTALRTDYQLIGSVRFWF